MLLTGAHSSGATDINGRCYPQPITLGVNEQPPDSSAQIQAANLRWVRITIPWRDVNPSSGVWNWGGIDALVNAHVARGNKILAILSTAPQWAGSNANGTRPVGIISDTSLWEDFVRRAAIRYNGKIKAYEIWNEPNLDNAGVGVGWDGAVFNLGRPTQLPYYAQYVQRASTQIRANAPGTLVVAPVTSSQPNSKTVDIFRSLEQYGTAAYMDVVSFHANAGDDESTNTIWSRIGSQLSTLSNRNPSNLNKPIWLTEFGWKSNRVGENGQRDRIANIAGLWTFQWSIINYPPFCGHIPKTALAFIYKDIDTPDSSQGIMRANGTFKPVVTGYLQTLPPFGVQPAAGYNSEGYRPFAASCVGRTCTFTSGYPQTGLRTYDWEFGDGTTGTGLSIIHTYATAGQYHVFHGVLGALEWPTDARIIEVH